MRTISFPTTVAPSRHAPLAIDAATFRTLGHRLVDQAIRWIPTDADMRLSLSALQHQIDRDRAAGDVPFSVVGTADTVSTGAIDSLPAIAAVCAEHDRWFHVDGACGGVANALADAPDVCCETLETMDAVVIRSGVLSLVRRGLS